MLKHQIIENQLQITCSKNHNQPIYMVVFDEKLTNNERLLCIECMNNYEGNVKIAGFQKVFSIIEDDQKRKTENIEQLIIEKKLKLELVKTNVQNLKTKILSYLDQLLGSVQEWKNYLDQILQSTFTYSFFEELDNLIKNKLSTSKRYENLMKNIQMNNQSCQQKMLTYLDQLMALQLQDECQELKRSLKILEESPLNQSSEQESSHNQPTKNQNFDLQLIDNQILQPEYCRAISFNNTNQIMISTCNSIIRVFRFQNSTTEEICKLNGHSMNVNILIFSKLSNSFISGSVDSSIRCWQQTEPTQWKSSKPYIQHSKDIFCIILNQKENLLFSGGADSIIRIWKLNFRQNWLEYQTQLQKHLGSISGLSLNDSETFLVSCGTDKRIIIWKKEGNDQIFNYIVKQSFDGLGYKVKFLRDDLFLWVATNAEVYVFELNKGIFEEKNEKKISLNQIFCKDCFLFPILYNANKNLIVIRHKQYIYIIRETLDHTFQIVKTIKCQSNKTSGSITNDGQFLVFWDCQKAGESGSYQTYRLYAIEQLFQKEQQCSLQ